MLTLWRGDPGVRSHKSEDPHSSRSALAVRGPSADVEDYAVAADAPDADDPAPMCRLRGGPDLAG